MPEGCNFIKKRLWDRCFLVNFVKFLRTPLFTEHLWVTSSVATYTIVAQYLKVLCRIIEYPAKSTSSEYIYGARTAEFLGERIPSVLISGKIIWEKKQSPARITFLCRTGQLLSRTWRHGKKEHLFYRTSPIV